MLGSSWHTHIDPVIWSLVHEMRISLVFPAVMLVLLRIGLVPVLTVALAASVLAGVAAEGDTHPYLRSALWTVHYLVFFVAGAGFARHRAGIAARLRHAAPSRVALMVLVGLLLFESRGLVPFGDAVVHYLVGVSALLMIALAIGAPRVSALLERPSLAWLGKVSYSLYLLHVPVLMACTYLFAHAMPLPLTMIPAALVTLVLCEAFYRGVEAPCIALGHRLSGPRPLKTARYSRYLAGG
jgi:peptidoglycan/LPS O-acetylase OafA/YrhL